MYILFKILINKHIMTLVTCIMKGGLGNQMFQLFTTIEYAFKHDIPFYLPNFKSIIVGTSPRPSYWNTFFKNLKPYTRNENLMTIQDKVHRETNLYLYSPIPFSNNHNIQLIGYFQNVKYFSEYSDKIIEKIGIKAFQKELKNIYKFDNTISLHFRIGDYKYSKLHLIIGVTYYKNALQKIISLTNKNIYIIKYCHEDEDSSLIERHINTLKIHFPNVKFERIDKNLDDWQQMLYMSLCDHNIIANSTFSWWSAFLNTNKNKIICIPEKWLCDNDHIPDLDCDYHIIGDI